MSRASGRKSIFCHPLRVNLLAIDNRILLFVASITNVEIEVSDVVSALRVDSSQTLLELFVAVTVESREEVVVLQAVLLFTWRDVVAMVVIAAALVHVGIASQVVIAVSSIAGPAPFCSRETQVDSFFGLAISFDGSFACFTLVPKRRVCLQRLLCQSKFHENDKNEKPRKHFERKPVTI